MNSDSLQGDGIERILRDELAAFLQAFPEFEGVFQQVPTTLQPDTASEQPSSPDQEGTESDFTVSDFTVSDFTVSDFTVSESVASNSVVSEPGGAGYDSDGFPSIQEGWSYHSSSLSSMDTDMYWTDTEF